MNRMLIRRNILTISIIIYLFFYGWIMYLKPFFLYNHDGSLREFGIGTSKKTVIPVWLVSLLLAILSYFSVLYYLFWPKLSTI